MFLCLLPAGAFRSQICEVEFGHILEKSSQEKLSTYFCTGNCNVVEQRLILDVDVIHYIKKGGGGWHAGRGDKTFPGLLTYPPHLVCQPCAEKS